MKKPDNHGIEQGYEKGSQVVLPVLPLRNLVALPKSIIPVVVGRDFSIKAVDAAMAANKQVFVTAQRSSDVDKPGKEDLFDYGTRAHILQVARMANGTLKILIEGLARSRIVEVTNSDDYLSVLAEDLIPVPVEDSADNTALWRNLYELFKEYVNLNEKMSTDVLGLFKGPQDLDYLADTIAVHMHLDFYERQQILETIDIKERALRLAVLLRSELEILKAEKSIRKRVQSQVEKHQRDYYLTEQMRAIQRELGREDYQLEIADLRKRANKCKLPAEAMEKVDAELKRLEQMQPTSPEASVSRNYVDWLIELPWHKGTKDTVSLKQAEAMLDSSHASMKKPKERVIEFLAARKFAKDQLKRAPILCLAGPPGVGKTSLAQSIADALGRKMVRISLGGMRDEAEIRGHRRTYIGAMPGKIIQVMKKAGVINPIILLDEIDKMAMDFRGDPASALLEVLDPEQNKDFSDNFLEVGYDLSKVMFITTANVADNIPYPLLDRMEMINLSGYTLEEKIAIAKKFLLPKVFKEHALESSHVNMSDKVLVKIIDEYTKEAGVRQLERGLAKVARKCIQEMLSNKKCTSVVVTDELIEKWFGSPPFRRPDTKAENAIGLVTGLAWTEVGGDVLEIEVTILPGKGALTLTGQLGEVMQESAQAAMSYTRSRAKDFGLKDNFYADVDIHIHIPEGAIPKDGPSAGVTMATGLISALTKIPVKADVAMTGEATLNGRVLAIGGLKEKLLAAIRFDKMTVIVPKANERDVQEFKNELDAKLTVVYATTIDDVLKHALTESPFRTRKVAPKKKKKKTTKKSPVTKKTSKKK
ncbi:endopeptidase La [Candidatus Babeliales bacterium]|nr:endopeptidase La [Candidatus Babeliales bacterium]